MLPRYAKQIVDAFANPKLQEEFTIFNRFIRENLNLEVRLLAMVDRALILKNYPKLIEIENKLWEQFQKDLDHHSLQQNLEMELEGVLNKSFEKEKELSTNSPILRK